MLRRLSILSVLLAVILTPAALAANVNIRVEGKTTTIFGAAQPRLGGRQRAAGPRRGQHGRRVLLRHDDGRLRHVRQPDRQVPGSRHRRLGVQGERRLAARRCRQGDAEGRRRRPLVLRHVRRCRRSADARAAATAGQLLRRADRQRRRQDGPRHHGDAHGGREALQDAGRPSLHRQACGARPGCRARRRSARTRCGDPSRAQRARSSLSFSPAAVVPPAGRRGRRSSGSRATEAPCCSSTRRSRPARR